MKNRTGFVLGVAGAMGIGLAGGALVGSLTENLALWMGLGPALGLAPFIGPIVALTQGKQDRRKQ